MVLILFMVILLSKALYSVFTATDIHPFTPAHIHTPKAESTTQGDREQLGWGVLLRDTTTLG